MDEFHCAKSSSDGHTDLCKSCKRDYDRKRIASIVLQTNVIIPSEKLCCFCGLVKPATEFYRNRASKDKLYQYCKSCSKIFNQKMYDKNPEPYKERARKQRKSVRTEVRNLWAQRYRTKYREKDLARQKASKAIRKGKIQKPQTCERCGEQFSNLQAHHENYEKPLEIVWLCESCHKLLHKVLNRSRK